MDFEGSAVPPRELFGAKALVNVLVSDVPAALSVLLLWFGLGLSAPDALALLALCVCMGLFIPVAGWPSTCGCRVWIVKTTPLW